MDDIPSYFVDQNLVSAVIFYLRYKRMGMPYSGWGETPNVLVEIVDTIEPLDSLYRPKVDAYGRMF